MRERLCYIIYISYEDVSQSQRLSQNRVENYTKSFTLTKKRKNAMYYAIVPPDELCPEKLTRCIDKHCLPVLYTLVRTGEETRYLQRRGGR